MFSRESAPERGHESSLTLRETRDRILVSAEKLFAEKGFKATTLKDVSSASGVNGALVSYYFGSKDGLRREVFARQCSGINSALEKLSKDHTLSLTDTLLELTEGNSILYRLHLWALLDGGDVATQTAEEFWNPMIARVQEKINMNNDGLTEAETYSRSVTLCGLLQHYAVFRWNYREQGNLETEEVLKAHRSLLRNMMQNLMSPPLKIVSMNEKDHS